MAENRFEDVKPHIVNIVHPSGEIHAIQVDPSVPASDFHEALSDYYHPNAPTAAGALENSPQFKQTVADVYTASGRGTQPWEAAALIKNDGSGQNLPVNHDKKGKFTLSVSPDVMATIHSHQDRHEAGGSPEDVAAARATHKTFYVVSNQGVFAIDPSGQTTQVYSNMSDAMNKKKQATPKSKW